MVTSAADALASRTCNLKQSGGPDVTWDFWLDIQGPQPLNAVCPLYPYPPPHPQSFPLLPPTPPVLSPPAPRSFGLVRPNPTLLLVVPTSSSPFPATPCSLFPSLRRSGPVSNILAAPTAFPHFPATDMILLRVPSQSTATTWTSPKPTTTRAVR
eukprot:2728098-Rhodomonas_salina.3